MTLRKSQHETIERELTGIPRLLDTISKWTNLSAIGKSRAARTSYVWLIIVPTFAKVMSTINPYLRLEIFGESITFRISLPFSWVAFFFAALAFTAGTLLYSLFCPSIIKDHDTASDFSDSGKGPRQLDGYAKETGYQVAGRDYNYDTSPPERGMLSDYTSTLPNESSISREYYYIREHADTIRTEWRYICALMYAAGFVLLWFVMIQNIWFVTWTALENWLDIANVGQLLQRISAFIWGAGQ